MGTIVELVEQSLDLWVVLQVVVVVVVVVVENQKDFLKLIPHQF
jgi:hypothetical protein